MCYWCDHLKLEPEKWKMEQRLVLRETKGLVGLFKDVPRAVAPSLFCGICGEPLPKHGDVKEEQPA